MRYSFCTLSLRILQTGSIGAVLSWKLTSIFRSGHESTEEAEGVACRETQPQADRPLSFV
jgi:hypothetical protein